MALRHAVACCVAAGAVACGSAAAAPGHGPGGFAGAAVPKMTQAADFALRDQTGRIVRLSGQHGRLVLLAFLYTECTDVCPVIAAQLNAAVRSLGHQASSVRVLAISVDPKHDTRRAARAYVRTHHLGPQFHWLLGSRAQLAPVWQAYNVLVEERNPQRLAHAAPIFLIDRNGKPRVFYGEDVRIGDVARDLRALLRGAG